MVLTEQLFYSKIMSFTDWGNPERKGQNEETRDDQS
jgi:hypothetical protein